jgi:polysaccharide biosynthesis/export protein
VSSLKLISLFALGVSLGQSAEIATANGLIRVGGAVKAEVTFQANGRVTLLDAIARAGGLAPGAGAEILVNKQRVSVQALIDLTDPDVNLLLVGGDEVRVPEAGKISVAGNVKKPGAFRLQPGAETSVRRLLIQAEGLTCSACNRAYIYRRQPSGKKSEIPVDLDKIVRGVAADATLVNGDILYVPDSAQHRLRQKAVEELLVSLYR